MPQTFIVECKNCGSFLLAAINQKTRTCPYCTSKVVLQKARRVATAQSAFEASEILRRLKAERQNNACGPKSGSNDVFRGRI